MFSVSCSCSVSLSVSFSLAASVSLSKKMVCQRPTTSVRLARREEEVAPEFAARRARRHVGRVKEQLDVDITNCRGHGCTSREWGKLAVVSVSTRNESTVRGELTSQEEEATFENTGAHYPVRLQSGGLPAQRHDEEQRDGPDDHRNRLHSLTRRPEPTSANMPKHRNMQMFRTVRRLPYVSSDMVHGTGHHEGTAAWDAVRAAPAHHMLARGPCPRTLPLPAMACIMSSISQSLSCPSICP